MNFDSILNTELSPEVKLICLVMATSGDFTKLTLDDLKSKTSLSSNKIKKALQDPYFEIVKDWVTEIIGKKVNFKSSSEIKEIIEYLNKVSGKRFRNTPANANFVKARLAEGATVAEMKAVIDMKCQEWENTDFEKYIRPSTLFNATKYNSYIGELDGDIIGSNAVDKPKEETNKVSDRLAEIYGYEED